MKVLIKFRHGLGDTIQLTSVLNHLRHYHPDWQLTVVLERGKHSAIDGLYSFSKGNIGLYRLADEVLTADPGNAGFDQVFDLSWDECYEVYADSPSTKVELCLRRVFKLEPIAELNEYGVVVSAIATERAAQYYKSIGAVCTKGRWNVMLLHYQGNTSTEQKNLSHEMAASICETAIAAGVKPVILDWDDRSPLPDNRTIFCPEKHHPMWNGIGTGDASQIAALIQSAQLFVGIDSGPQKVALATSTPTLAIWVGMHPVHYAVPTENAFHLLQEGRGSSERAGGKAADEYFAKHYRRGNYRSSVEVTECVAGMLQGERPEDILNRKFLRQLHSTAYNESYYREHKDAGLDYLEYGGWQQSYGRWFVQSLGLRGKKVLDVGCACGSILRGLGEAGAIVQGIELNEHMLHLARSKWPDMAPLVHCCDACNMHLFKDNTWDAIHCAQVAEHWKPELVPHILAECYRVLKPGGIMWVALDTQELFERQGRTLENDDPTHLCIRPAAWWQDQLTAGGWRQIDIKDLLTNHPESFLRQYDWDWFAAEKPGVTQLRESA